MVSEADILEALRNSPTLKTLLDLPRRVAALEQRLADMQDRVEPIAPASDGDCPFCRGHLRITEERDHPQFGMMGVKLRTLICGNCGEQVTRDWDPGKA